MKDTSASWWLNLGNFPRFFSALFGKQKTDNRKQTTDKTVQQKSVLSVLSVFPNQSSAFRSRSSEKKSPTSNLESVIFYLFILFLPTQFGKHFWLDFSYVLGLRVDYLSPTLYTTDILLFLLFLFSLPKLISSLSDPPAGGGSKGFSLRPSFAKAMMGKQAQTKIAFSLIILFISFSIFLSTNPMIGWYWLLKFLEMSFLAWYMVYVPLSFRRNNVTEKSQSFSLIRFLTSFEMTEAMGILFSIAVIFESLLAFLQFIHQGSLGGILYFFGERTFTASTPGIANASIAGQLILRPYGTFSHPNVLAGYLLVSMLLIMYFYFPFHARSTPGVKGPNTPGVRSLKRRFPLLVGEGQGEVFQFIGRIFLLFTVAVGSFGIFLTLSRAAILAWLLCLLAFFLFYFKNKTKQLLLGFFALFTSFFLSFLFFPDIVYRFLFSLSDESVVERIVLSQAALQMILSHPLFGVGPGNFIPSLPQLSSSPGTLNGATLDARSAIQLWQPVHNIFLLIAAELGIPGLMVFLGFLLALFKKLFQKWKKSSIPVKKLLFPLLLALSAILFTGMFDHYWLTLQQGQLLFGVVIGLILRSVLYS